MATVETDRIHTNRPASHDLGVNVTTTSFADTIDLREEQSSTQILRDLVARDTGNLSSEQTHLIAQIKLFLEWLDDDRPEVAANAGDVDKFADLIALSRYYEDLTAFYVGEVGVNPSTIWRWAAGKSRPSRFVAEQIAKEVRRRLVDALTGLAYDLGRY